MADRSHRVRVTRAAENALDVVSRDARFSVLGARFMGPPDTDDPATWGQIWAQAETAWGCEVRCMRVPVLTTEDPSWRASTVSAEPGYWDAPTRGVALLACLEAAP
jgi:hypothetical protein